MVEKSGIPKPALIAGAIAIIAIAVFFIFKSATPSDSGRTYPDTPEVIWLRKRSVEVAGDFSKLTPEEQARAEKATSGRGAMSVGIYGHAKSTPAAH